MQTHIIPHLAYSDILFNNENLNIISTLNKALKARMSFIYDLEYLEGNRPVFCQFTRN